MSWLSMVVRRSVLPSLQNGPFGILKRPVLHDETARFAMQNGLFRYLAEYQWVARPVDFVNLFYIFDALAGVFCVAFPMVKYSLAVSLQAFLWCIM